MQAACTVPWDLALCGLAFRQSETKMHCRSVVESGALWQVLLRRDYPASQLTASSAAGFRHAYLLQATNTVEELHCFFTKATFEEQVSALPC